VDPTTAADIATATEAPTMKAASLMNGETAILMKDVEPVIMEVQDTVDTVDRIETLAAHGIVTAIVTKVTADSGIAPVMKLHHGSETKMQKEEETATG
jgi:hypothetical protein